MKFSDWLLVLSTLFSPIIAVSVTLWWQDRKEKRDAKHKLFLSLMAHRKSIPLSPEWVNGLNTIDVVFADTPQVIDLWHKYYESLINPPVNENYQTRWHIMLSMLTAMARALGHKNLEQTDIDKFYFPQGHSDQLEINYQCQTEWLRVLKATAHLNIEKRHEPTIPL